MTSAQSYLGDSVQSCLEDSAQSYLEDSAQSYLKDSAQSYLQDSAQSYLQDSVQSYLDHSAVRSAQSHPDTAASLKQAARSVDLAFALKASHLSDRCLCLRWECVIVMCLLLRHCCNPLDLIGPLMFFVLLSHPLCFAFDLISPLSSLSISCPRGRKDKTSPSLLSIRS